MVDEVDEFETGLKQVVIPDGVDLVFLRAEERTLRQIMAELKDTSPVLERIHHVFITHNEAGQPVKKHFIVERSLYTLAHFLMMRMTHRDIASIYARSVGTVASMSSELRNHPVIVRFVLGLGREVEPV